MAHTVPYLFQDCPMEHLVSMVADMLERLLKHNDQIPLHPDALTRFHSRTAPSISVLDYLRRVVRYTNLEKACLLITLHYIDQMCGRLPRFTISSLTVHRFLIASVCVSTKALCDAFCTNSHYAKIGGIKLAELNVLEREFLSSLEWRLICSPELLQEYYVNLARSHSSGAFIVEDPPPATAATVSPAASASSSSQSSSLSESSNSNANSPDDSPRVDAVNSENPLRINGNHVPTPSAEDDTAMRVEASSTSSGPHQSSSSSAGRNASGIPPASSSSSSPSSSSSAVAHRGRERDRVKDEDVQMDTSAPAPISSLASTSSPAPTTHSAPVSATTTPASAPTRSPSSSIPPPPPSAVARLSASPVTPTSPSNVMSPRKRPRRTSMGSMMIEQMDVHVHARRRRVEPPVPAGEAAG